MAILRRRLELLQLAFKLKKQVYTLLTPMAKFQLKLLIPACYSPENNKNAWKQQKWNTQTVRRKQNKSITTL